MSKIPSLTINNDTDAGVYISPPEYKTTLKSRPKYISKKLWLKLASIFVNIEIVEPKMFIYSEQTNKENK